MKNDLFLFVYLLEVQDYLENSCDPELGSPATRNMTDSVLGIPVNKQTQIDSLNKQLIIRVKRFTKITPTTNGLKITTNERITYFRDFTANNKATQSD